MSLAPSVRVFTVKRQATASATRPSVRPFVRGTVENNVYKSRQPNSSHDSIKCTHQSSLLLLLLLPLSLDSRKELRNVQYSTLHRRRRRLIVIGQQQQ